jgi:hypothetical protein
MPWRMLVVARKVHFWKRGRLVEQPGTRLVIEKRRARANLVIVLRKNGAARRRSWKGLEWLL